MGKVADESNARKNMLGLIGAALILAILPTVVGQFAELAILPDWLVALLDRPFQILYMGLVFLATVFSAVASEFPEEEKFFLKYRGKLIFGGFAMLIMVSVLLTDVFGLERRPTLEDRIKKLEERSSKQPNQALEPTPIAVTPRAYARLAPATAVAHL